jgi:nucleolar protein 56
MRSYWFGDVDVPGCTGADMDQEALAGRLNSIMTTPSDIVPPDWRVARDCGAVKDRSEYLGRLRELCLRVARERVAVSFRKGDTELIQMVLVLEGIDQAVNQLTERLGDWYRVLHPEGRWKHGPKDSRKILAKMGVNPAAPVKEILDGILRLRDCRTCLAREIDDRAARILPNCASVIGGLVTARLMALAGSLSRLSQLPTSSIQVLGARGALFSHLTRGTPPPKHGIIYQHLRVHNAPRGARGRVARVLAGRLAIAARIDCYRGALDPGFIIEANRKIEAAGRRR